MVQAGWVSGVGPRNQELQSVTHLLLLEELSLKVLGFHFRPSLPLGNDASKASVLESRTNAKGRKTAETVFAHPAPSKIALLSGKPGQPPRAAPESSPRTASILGRKDDSRLPSSSDRRVRSPSALKSRSMRGRARRRIEGYEAKIIVQRRSGWLSGYQKRSMHIDLRGAGRKRRRRQLDAPQQTLLKLMK